MASGQQPTQNITTLSSSELQWLCIHLPATGRTVLLTPLSYAYRNTQVLKVMRLSKVSRSNSKMDLFEKHGFVAIAVENPKRIARVQANGVPPVD